MHDLEFIQRCAKREKLAWDEFVGKYSHLIYNYIYSVLKTKGLTLTQENINDLFQGIFLSLINDNCKKLRSFKARNGCSLASWLRQITINYTIDYLRKLKPLVSIDEENEQDSSLKDILADDSASVTDTLSQKEKLESLKECIARLETEDKYFLELHFHRNLRLEELRELFKISRPAIDMRKSRIIKALRECFISKGFRLDF